MIDVESLLTEMYEKDTGNCFDDPASARLPYHAKLAILQLENEE